jgi:hypothetical protein
MQTDTQKSVYISKITAMVATMPLDRVREVYDFTEFVNERITSSTREVDAIFDDLLLSDEGQQALHDLLKSSGPALPMFDENGKWLVDDSECLTYSPNVTAGNCLTNSTVFKLR